MKIQIEAHIHIHSETPEALQTLQRSIDAMSANVTNLDSKLDDLSTAIATELQQLKDAITAGAAGQAAIDQVNRASSRIDDAINALKSDDTPPAP